MKVLIIDDSPSALAIAEARLADEDVTVLCADEGRAGLILASQERPDLILLDVDMPGMSGFDVCRRLKLDVDLRMIPVIFLSGSGDGDSKIRGLDLGAVDYVTKPFDTFELCARVRSALRTKRLQDMLSENAHIDPLTGLANRRALMERLESEWARVQRYDSALSFIMADIDHFKQINDRYGHSAGDRLLQQVSRTIAAQCRQNDLPTRYGGEEFAIIVPDEDADLAATLAERCRCAVAAVPVPADKKRLQITASFGVADTLSAESIEGLIQAADEALYAGKRSGRNIVCIAAGLGRASGEYPTRLPAEATGE